MKVVSMIVYATGHIYKFKGQSILLCNLHWSLQYNMRFYVNLLATTVYNSVDIPKLIESYNVGNCTAGYVHDVCHCTESVTDDFKVLLKRRNKFRVKTTVEVKRFVLRSLL